MNVLYSNDEALTSYNCPSSQASAILLNVSGDLKITKVRAVNT